jgi:two-component system cell cycle sensor histidine kinase/response regulator CckA
MHQILMNLCINAVEAMPNGGILTIETKNEVLDGEDKVVLTVKDTGVGMTQEVQEHLFEPFFTTKKEENKKGTGLGLAVVYGIVKNHGGWIDYDTELGRGTTFRVVFNRGILKLSETHENHCEQRIHQTKILIVEDEEIIQKVLIKLLNSMNIPCICAQNGQIALDIYSKEKETIKGVILDLKMPVMDGKTTFFELKKMNPNVKVVVSTGFGENEEAQELMNAGAVGILAKPYRKEELKNALSYFN